MLIDFTAIKLETGFAALSCTFNNATVDAGFRATEIGVWVTNPDQSSGEVLYAYGYAPDGEADCIPSSQSRILETQLDVLVYVGEAKNISASISASLVYVGHEEFKKHCEAQNPHGTTAADFGLESFENKTPEDLTPSFIQAKKPANIVSGDKVSTILGKAARAIFDFYNHILDTKNPHDVTLEQLGAARSSHNHSTADINAGTLGVGRGGTGLSSVPENSVLIGGKDENLVPISVQELKKLMDISAGKWLLIKTSTLASENEVFKIDVPLGYQRYRFEMDLVSVNGQDSNLDIRFNDSTVTRLQKDKGVHGTAGRDLVLIVEMVPGSYPSVQIINNDPSYPPVYGLAPSGNVRNANWDTAIGTIALYATGTRFKRGSKVTIRGFK